MGSYALKVRGGCDTYVKRDGKVGTAGKGALASEELAFTVAATQDQQIVQDGEGWVVRRLTPLECERLQGFPDGWTDVPFRGWNAPDTRRYKALGNSMAVPVMAWIGSRLQMVSEVLHER